MPIEVPSGYAVWDEQLSNRVRWPAADEEAVAELGRLWQSGSELVRQAGTGAPTQLDSWQDPAGDDARKRIDETRTAATTSADQLAAVGAHVTALSQDITVAKATIRNAVVENEPIYQSMRTMLFWPDNSARDEFGRQLGVQVNNFLDELARKVASR